MSSQDARSVHLKQTREQFSHMSELWPISQRTAANPARQPSLICKTAYRYSPPQGFSLESDWRHV